MINSLDEEMTPIGAITLYRVAEPQEFESLQVGDAFVDKAFVSTTQNETALDRIYSDAVIGSERPVVFEISTAKDTLGIDVNSMLGEHEFQHQDEILLNRGLEFIVNRIEAVDFYGLKAKKIYVSVSSRKLRTAKDTAKRIGSFEMRFDAKTQAVIDWADRHAAELIDNITETSREAINNAISELQETGDWDAYYDEILDAVGDEDRANLIARHESMLAAGEGQRQAWDQAVDKGMLTGDEERAWIVTGDEKVCPTCEGLEDKRAKLGDPYVGDDGEEYDGPPAHVQCRCTEGIA